MTEKERLYHLYVKSPKGVEMQVTGYPMTHEKCMTMKSKNTNPNRFYVKEYIQIILGE